MGSKKMAALAAMVAASVVWGQVDWTADEISITTAAELRALASQVNGGNNFSGRMITLTDNIDLGSGNWTPIGNSVGNSFRGTFDGGDFIISGININNSSNIQGLFGVIGGGGTVKNLRIANVNIVANTQVGALAGHNRGGKIENVFVVGQIKGDGDVGGLVGRNDIHGDYVGTIFGSGAKVDIITSQNRNGFGGLVGRNIDGAKIINSYAVGNLSGDGDNVGGLSGTNGGFIERSYSSGNVQGRNFVGGLVGNNGNTIIESYALGNVSGNSQVGGLVGLNSNVASTIVYSYAVGRVSANESFGWLAGNDIAVIRNVRHRGQEQNMKDAATYTGWDFTDIWGMPDNNHINRGYPFLQVLRYIPTPCEWIKWETIRAATCVATGEEKSICPLCSAVNIRETEIDENAHLWDRGIIKTAATCVQTGETLHTCRLDETHTKIEITQINPNAHTWDEGEVEIAATCTNVGLVNHICLNDEEHTKTVEVPMLRHQFGSERIRLIPHTCTEDGIEALVCSVCNYHSERTIIALGHSKGDCEDSRKVCIRNNCGAYIVCEMPPVTTRERRR